MKRSRKKFSAELVLTAVLNSIEQFFLFEKAKRQRRQLKLPNTGNQLSNGKIAGHLITHLRREVVNNCITKLFEAKGRPLSSMPTWMRTHVRYSASAVGFTCDGGPMQCNEERLQRFNQTL